MMSDPHAGYILASYVATVAAVAGLTLYIIADYRAQARKLALLEEQGLTRRSRRAAKDKADRPDWDT